MKIVKTIIYAVASILIQHYYNYFTGYSGGAFALLFILFFDKFDDKYSLSNDSINLVYSSHFEKVIIKIKVIVYLLLAVFVQHYYNVFTESIYGVSFAGGGIGLLFFMILFRLDTSLALFDVKVTNAKKNTVTIDGETIVNDSKNDFIKGLVFKFKFIFYMLISFLAQHLYNHITFNSGNLFTGGGISVLTYLLLIKLDDSIVLFYEGQYKDNQTFFIKNLKKFIFIIIFILSILFQHILNKHVGNYFGGASVLFTTLVFTLFDFIYISKANLGDEHPYILPIELFIKFRALIYVTIALYFQYLYSIKTLDYYGFVFSAGGFSGLLYAKFVFIDKQLKVISN